MLERLKAYIGLQLAKFQFRNEVDKPQELTQFFSGAKNVLIVLPLGYEEAVIASNALRAFKARLNHLHLTVVNNGTRATSLIEFSKCEVIRMNPADVNKLFLPTPGIMQRILSKEYDVAMDLNLDFVLHTAYICKASKAKARVGFSAGSTADTFFNVQLNLKMPAPPQAMYEKFAACLSMF
ncbi:MAG: hypothetical protein EPO24_13905 [Bacteroidetes bacterium]|nr:MAG: hypothetical protein EPO24_13905 [Bacteroidota bacterium]